MQKVSRHSHSLLIELQKRCLSDRWMSRLKLQETLLFMFTNSNWTVKCYPFSFELLFHLTVSYRWTAAQGGCSITFWCEVLSNVKSHTSRCLNLLLSTVTASLWFKWMDDTVSWGDLTWSCLRWCWATGLGDFALWMIVSLCWTAAGWQIRPGYQSSRPLIRPYCIGYISYEDPWFFLINDRTKSCIPSCSLGPRWAPSLEEQCYPFVVSQWAGKRLDRNLPDLWPL